MLSAKLFSAFSLLPLLALAAPSQILLRVSEDDGIPQSLFNDFNNLSKIVDITNCLQTVEGVKYPFECNSFCKEFLGFKLVKQWNTNESSNLAEEGSSGYIAVDHDERKIFVAIAGSYIDSDTSGTAVDYTPPLSGNTIGVCPGCKVHGRFYGNWVKTERLIGDVVEDFARRYIEAKKEDPYHLVLVGKNSGGAVATLAAVDFEAKGWNPQVTTFGQPKVGNEAFADYLTRKFSPSTYRRVTHVSDPVPQLPPGFSHYEHVYFISKPFVPYGPSDILVCNTPLDPACASSSLGLDWTPSDYFHHTDNCIRETASSFSILTLEFDILEPFANVKGANSNPRFYPALETINEVPEPEDGNDIWSWVTTVNDPNAGVSTIVSERNLMETLRLVRDSDPRLDAAEEEVYALEYEDEELYSAMTNLAKAQVIQLRPAPEKRGISLDSDSDIIPSASLSNALVMLDEEREDNLPPPIEYEDEELYHTMAGFDKAQQMWIKKPQEAGSKQKISKEFFGEKMFPKKDGVVKRNIAEWEPGTEPITYTIAKKEKRNVHVHPQTGHAIYLQNLDSKNAIVMDKAEELAKETESMGLRNVLEKRSFERALRYFHAPKHLFDAQLAANQEAALYNAKQKAATGPAVGEAKSGDPDEDYFKKAGSVLILDGRPLEVDGKPVMYEPPAPKEKSQKRSQIPSAKSGHGPGLGVRRRVKPGSSGRKEKSANGQPTPSNVAQKTVVENEKSMGDNIQKRDYLPASNYFIPDNVIGPEKFPLEGYCAPGMQCHPEDLACICEVCRVFGVKIPDHEPIDCGGQRVDMWGDWHADDLKEQRDRAFAWRPSPKGPSPPSNLPV